MLSVLTLGAWADDVTAVVDNISSYSGTASYVYNKADKQVYVRNNMGTYEPYGKYYTEVEYIESTGSAYINTGYIHKANTRIVADVEFTAENGNWNAVFGSRKGGGAGATNGLVYFWRADGDNKGMYKRNITENFGRDQSSAVGAVINQRYTIDANGNTVTLTKQGESSAYSTITCTGEFSVGDNPLFIFDLSTGNGTPDGSRSKMKLYSFKIYEGNDLVRDYVPITANGEGGLYDKVNDTTIGATGSLACGPITTYYNGKIIYDPTDKVVKKHNGSEFVSIGNMNPDASINATEYKNMKNWTSFPNWWTGVFNSGDNIQWDANTQTNTFDPYVGIGGWEPLYKTLDLDDGVYYVSFKYSGSAWTSHGDFTTLPFLIVKGSNVYQNFDGGYNADNIISYIKLPNTETQDASYNQYFSSTTGKVTLEVQFGVLTDGSQGFWFKFADIDIKKCVFPENYPVVNFSHLINSLVEEVEAFDTKNTTDALATSLNTAKTAARNSLDDAEDLEGQLNAMEALQTAFGKAKAIDAAILRKTVALAEEEGVSHDEADNVLSNAETQKDVDDALAALRLARKRHNAEKVVEEFKGTTPADGLECYLYNVGEKKFLCGGNDWGAHASLGFAAHYVKLIGNDSDGYEIKTYLLDSGHNKSDGQYLGHGGYMDSDPGNKWKFVSQGDNKYNIVWADAESKLLGYNGGTVNNVITECVTTTGPTNQWKLVTKAERDALLVNATPDNPVDATYYIDNPGFDQRWTIEKWTMTDMAVNNRGQQKSDFVVSGWNESGDGNTKENYRIEQVITGLMPGLYEVGVQACYRHGDDSEDDGERVAKLFANNQETTILGVKDEINKIPQYTTLGTDEKAIEAFQTGLYKNKVRVAVGTDGRLTIGVKRDQDDSKPYDWLAADNFRLTYLGPTSESVTVTSAGYATYCSENALDFTGKDIKAYVGTKNGDKLTFTPITQVPANTGLLLVYEGGKTEDVPVIASASAVEGNCLVGVNVETAINSNDYILNKINDGVGFYKAGSWTTLGAHKAYIPAAVGNGVKGFTIDFDDDATGISLMEEGRSKMEDGAIYNVAGQRLNKMQKGINIVNGKKIAVK